MRILIPILCLALTACSHPTSEEQTPKLTSITLIDSNGFTETITTADRLQQYQRVDFSTPQSYKKVLRVYGRDQQGNVSAYLTSYHTNGQLKQFLEAKNNNAYGLYQEWFPTGQKKIEALVIGGNADLTPAAESTWIFDSTSRVWEEDGSLAATIQYNKGILEGPSLYYHKNGNLWKRIPFTHDAIEGTYEIYLDNGEPLQTTQYHNGVKDGLAIRYWPGGTIAAQETYDKGLLIHGKYLDKSNNQVALIQEGNGYRALFSADAVAELHEYRHGKQEGQVKVFDKENTLINLYHVKDGIKHGEEIEYYEKKLGTSDVKPKVLLTWYQGIIQGIVKTWHDNGILESQREISHNQKNGLLTAWYRDGSLMLIEEYEKDLLMRGEYYKKAEKTPISQIWDGSGIASLYDSEGNFVRKINYHLGKPQE